MDNVKRLFQQGATVGIGICLLLGLNWLFDYIAYPITMYKMGSVAGAIIMTLASIPFNYFLIRGYDLIGKDLLGMEALKNFEADGENDSRLKRFLGRVLARGKVGTFIFISLYDPIPATIYMRDRVRSYKGLHGSDWKWFGISTAIANIFWIIAIATGIEVFDFTYGYILEILTFVKDMIVEVRAP